ncbi:peptidase M61 [Jiulongibacter sediminis]|jgi:predicted metalloprotease with PDZ domain|uniref:M61 family metallopeptidase n=1 Tax=Jiulongibacter sediminis TaxID=1605367 RepID=UPI0026EAF7C3|nr:peptidase M61 [Jiulongibacter sediminis]
MRQKLILALLIFIAGQGFAQKYQYSIDLNQTVDDKLQVELVSPKINGKSIVFYLPKTVPGTYSTDNYGRYVENLEAFDKNGRNLKVRRLDDNSWRIFKAKRIERITYWVNDSFDEVRTGGAIFEPAGSNIEKDENYVLNTHCFFGYFQDRKQIPFELTVKHQANLVATTSLIDEDASATVDQFEAVTYNRLVDSPIMYAKENNASIKIGDSEVVIGVYSPNGVVKADYLAENLKKLLDAQVAYIGEMPVKKYAFIIYLTDKAPLSGSQGALEHSFSSLYFLPEVAGDRALPFIMDVSAHEFFHILTPLNTHSEEIHYFDFNNPQMSKHLWLYEGSTEYHAHLAQTRYGLKSKEDFYEEISNKITTSRTRYKDDLPFTIMSERVLEEEYEPEYGNVYQKGALISMCLDLMLRKDSDGGYGIIDLVNDLSDVYGSEKPFKDDELFDQIEKMTSPEVRAFLDNHVAGPQPLPLEEVLSWVGVDFIPEMQTGDSTVSLGSISIGVNEDRQIIVADNSNMNEFGQEMGYQQGDILLEMNGQEVGIATFRSLVADLQENGKTGEQLTMKIKREEDGVFNEMELSAPIMKIAVVAKNVLKDNPNASEKQVKLRNAWLSAQ